MINLRLSQEVDCYKSTLFKTRANFEKGILDLFLLQHKKLRKYFKYVFVSKKTMSFGEKNLDLFLLRKKNNREKFRYVFI